MPGINPFQSWAKILDCGDAPLTFLDNTIALKQLEKAHTVCYNQYIFRQLFDRGSNCVLTCQNL